MAFIRIKRKKRKPGDRAGMTKTKIALAAATLIEKEGGGAFSLRQLARTLGVAPATITAHFKGGQPDIEDEVVRLVFANVAPPFRPRQQPAEYVEEMFSSVMRALQGRPMISMLTILRLTRNPLTVPNLAERSLASLSALGVAPTKMAEAYRATLQTLFALILNGPGRAYLVPEAKSLASLESFVAPLSLSAGEYPHIFEFGEAILASLAEARSWTPDFEAARSAVGRLAEVLAELEDEAPGQEMSIEDY